MSSWEGEKEPQEGGVGGGKWEKRRVNREEGGRVSGSGRLELQTESFLITRSMSIPTEHQAQLQPTSIHQDHTPCSRSLSERGKSRFCYHPCSVHLASSPGSLLKNEGEGGKPGDEASVHCLCSHSFSFLLSASKKLYGKFSLIDLAGRNILP